MSILKSLKPRLSDQYHITSIGVFGSVIHGTQTDESDIDVLVEFSDPPGLFGFIEIENSLSDILKVRVDLVDAEGIKPRLKRRILYFYYWIQSSLLSSLGCRCLFKTLSRGLLLVLFFHISECYSIFCFMSSRPWQKIYRFDFFK